MINLFNIPNYFIDTSKFRNLLHDRNVVDFELAFADYVGAEFAVSFNSATSGLFLFCKFIQALKSEKRGFYQLRVPSMIPYVVPNAILNAGADFEFVDDVFWVGSKYCLGEYSWGNIWDSAQEVTKNSYKDNCKDSDIMLFSFYPTKPVGSCDGGMIVTNNIEVAKILRTLSMNGMTNEINNWERKLIMLGHKMYMNSISAFIAHENLKKLNEKQSKLASIRKYYNTELGYENNSSHLYRIIMMRPGIRDIFIKKANEAGIMCGIHYEAAHEHPLYDKEHSLCTESSAESRITVSIPFHENLTKEEMDKVIEFVKKYER